MIASVFRVLVKELKRKKNKMPEIVLFMIFYVFL